MEKPFDKKRLLFYLLVTLAYISLWTISNAHSLDGTLMQVVLNNAWRGIYILVLNCIFFEFTLPFVMRKRRNILFNILLAIPALWIHIMFWSYGLFAWRLLGIGLGVYTSLFSYDSSSKAVTAQMGFSAGSIFFVGIARHIYNYVKLKQATQQLRIEKQQAELNYLKSQTNPHFLFNTLNNIYSLSRDKSDLAPESILKLSKILRFMLYETGGAYIAIEQELKIIDDYIALEKLRYDSSLSVNFNHNVEDPKQAIPPLLLIPLVENAFKHGVSETRGYPFVDIHLSIKQRELVFVVKNSSEAVPGEMTVKENIGLSNLRRQLELLYREYNLSAEQGNGVFTAVLKIKLASHV